VPFLQKAGKSVSCPLLLTWLRGQPCKEVVDAVAKKFVLCGELPSVRAADRISRVFLQAILSDFKDKITHI
jgi:hypothetical protein